jgi:hypothetical protein
MSNPIDNYPLIGYTIDERNLVFSLPLSLLSRSREEGTFFVGNLMGSKLLAVTGFLALALSPSFVDYQQSPELRWQIGLYYVVGIALIWAGLDGWAGERS